MATFTEHYDLIKPGTDDYYDVADFNENMDAIDTQLYQAEQDMAAGRESGYLPLFHNRDQKKYQQLVSKVHQQQILRKAYNFSC